MDRHKKVKTTVTIAVSDAQILANKLVYKTAQDPMDDLAMSLILPTANSVAPRPKLQVEEGSGGSAEVAQPKSDTN